MTALINLIKMLEKTEWQTKEQNKTIVEKSLDNLVQHAFKNVPFYRKFYKHFFKANPHIKISLENFYTLPILERTDFQNASNEIISNKIPAHHGRCYPKETSGSTGKPIQILGTDMTNLFYNAYMFREHKWRGRDFNKTLMSITWLKKGFAIAPYGHIQNTWGAPFDEMGKTGRGILINIACPTEKQIEGLLHYKPNYLITYPSQAEALGHYIEKYNLDVSFLEEIRTTGETCTENCLINIKKCLPHIKYSDIYSCVEIGNVAHQCEENSLHVNTEHVYVEILDENCKPCVIGQTGKILLTSLANYATPLIRYEVGDYGIWDEYCTCGRTSPVIRKVLGRKRNRLKLPNGECRFPYLGEREERKKITQDVLKFQLIQHSLNEIEYKVVLNGSINCEQESALKKMFQKNFGEHFNIKITKCADIPTGATGKYEEFISLI